ncbi:response regulator receiver protein [Desulfovibrio sp. X2]|uniref:CD3324 family protein n=1 Tax=Desulfovibrio sp. X2 TaxID=941449 RepID=UPI00035896FD|nr:CD3324 family protein [Desulfovibrio sp. X2]EPR42122.1 response regulator receiver protein [Desulfovibrio sp. X2]
MSCRKANDLLPPHLLRAVQEYIDGECLYIPRKEGNRKRWGENTPTRQRLRARNREIAAGRREGWPVAALAERYFLSVKAVYKILAAMKDG